MASEQDIINTLIAEALGEGEEGMRLVGETILNRSAIRGLTPEQVVRQPAQYTGYSNPGPAAVRAQSDPNAVSAAQAAWALAQGADDPTRGADHYYAPGTISQPSWARGMQPTLQDGGHNFYSSQPVPQRARVAPAPAQMSAAGGALRQVTSPTGGNSSLQAALNQYAIREGNRVTPMTMQGTDLTAPGAVAQSVGSTRQDPALAAALGARVAPRPTVSASDMARGSPAQTRNVATTVASFPTASLTSSTPARVDYSPDGVGIMPTMQGINRLTSGSAANSPVASSGVGQAPATRVVQSVPITANSSSEAARRAALSIGGNQSYAGQERGPVTSSVPGPAGVAKGQERLPTGSAVPLGFNPSATGAAIQSGGLSRDALARQQAYNATALNPPTQAVQPVQTAAMPPMPIRRPMTPSPQAAPIQAIQPQQRPAMFNAAQPAPVQQAQPMALARAPLNVLVQGSNTIQPPQPSRTPPVGAVLGVAPNGGVMIQGSNGVMNTTTQNSEAWKQATGQQDRYTRTGSGSFESESGGVYYDRHL